MPETQSSPTEPKPDPTEDPRWDILIDAAGFSPDQARAAITGVVYQDRPAPVDDSGARRQAYGTGRRSWGTSHRGGRSHPEASDSALDPYWNASAGHPSDEQVAINQAGAKLARTHLGLAQAARGARQRVGDQ